MHSPPTTHRVERALPRGRGQHEEGGEAAARVRQNDRRPDVSRKQPRLSAGRGHHRARHRPVESVECGRPRGFLSKGLSQWALK